MFDDKITRSKRKTMAIHVTKDAAVEVKAPLKMPIPEIERFIRLKQAWIEQSINKVTKQSNLVKS